MQPPEVLFHQRLLSQILSPLPFASVDIRFHLLSISLISDYSNLAYSDLQYIDIRPFSHWCFGILWSQLTPRYELFIARTSCTLPRPLKVRHKSFTAQPLDLLSWRYVYLLVFDLFRNLARHLVSYPVSVRRLKNFATPLPPSIPLLIPTCGSLHLAVNTRDGTFTRKTCAMPGTQKSRHFKIIK